MYKIDFTEPHWLIYTYHTIGGVSLCINLFGIYLLTFELKELGAFRYYLMLFQVVCSLADITITTLSSIVPLYPLFAISSYGILALWLDVSAHYCLINVGVWAYLEMESLLLCFFKKHQTIAVIIDVHVIPKFIPYFCYLMAIVFPAIPCVGLDFLTVQEEKQLEYINMTSPEYYTKFASLPNFSIFSSHRPVGIFQHGPCPHDGSIEISNLCCKLPEAPGSNSKSGYSDVRLSYMLGANIVFCSRLGS
ncbi:G protein-coupled receptor [Caenorhabditis elegans]|uniref:G protein-coupled receptor n=1 Tax=Caenorhabditis elegans TaxID=6239 RepID=C6S3M3_CAEEL|nr:G protein-coupled receptor [Caenorhabditis elegans]CBA11618.1 G protein-coupled receptor [Caenorhabditis elegans]|eukprot:NP_001256892.1 Serpentine Receptor, class I [Caenorhabditis elegans]